MGRRDKKVAILMAGLLGALLLAGCGSGSRAVLYSGVGLMGKPRVITDAEALRDGRDSRARWIAEVELAGRERGGAARERFSNLPAAEFRRRLDAAASRYHFTVKTMRFLHPLQAAPLVLVQTSRYLAFARAVPAIERSLDPVKRSGLRGTDWAFEGFRLEAQDERGVPFLIVTNAVRGSIEGGQWARAEALYPFAHG
jgi:hypothetical protein